MPTPREAFRQDLSAKVITLTGPKEEFFNHHHGKGGLFTSEGSDSLATKNTPFHDEVSKEAVHKERIRKLKKVALVTVVVIASIGMLLEGAAIGAKGARHLVVNEALKHQNEKEPVQKTFSQSGVSGKVLTLHDHSGKITGDQAKSLLGNLQEIHSKVKIKGAIKIGRASCRERVFSSV